MAQNLVEYHIQDGAFHTFKVASGQTIKIGQLVEVVGDNTVGVATAGSNKVVGVVYSGTVGLDGLNDGYKGDNGDVVTVVSLRPLVYLQAGANVVAGDVLKAGGGGVAVKADTTGGTGYDKIGVALQGASTGQRFLAMLGY